MGTENIMTDGNKINLIEPYAPRPFRFLELWEVNGWRIKVYGIAYKGELPRPELVEAAKVRALAHLVDNSDPHYSVGFLGVHDGRGANFIFIDYWADENELHHHVYISPTDDVPNFRYATPTGLIACVWDLQLMAFERQAWVETVLANPAGPDVEAYLACRYNGDA